MNIAIIPARGGSKRIKKKNIKDFCGKPIISYSIEIAKKSKAFDKIFVSTDDKEIADIAKSSGAEVPFLREKNLSDDLTGTHYVIGSFVQKLIESGSKINYACCIYATAPLIQISDLLKGLDLIKENKWDMVFAATLYNYPVSRSFRIKTDNSLEMLFEDKFNSRSQDLENVYHDAGQFYWSKPEIWMGENPGYGSSSSVVLLPNWRVQDIDNLEDWRRAELIFSTLTDLNNK